MKRKIVFILLILALLYGAFVIGYNFKTSERVLSGSIVTEPEVKPAKPKIDLESLLTLTNEQRTANGLSSLLIDPHLNASAQEKCAHMTTNNYWAHDAPDGTKWPTFIDKQTTYKKAGENLARSYETTQDIIDGWMNSPGHRENILTSSFDNIGFGICEKSKEVFVVQHFTDMI